MAGGAIASGTADPIAGGAAGAPELHVCFRVDRTEYAVPAKHVLVLESYAGATEVPGAPPHVAGIVLVRGRIVPVIDLRALFGLEPRAPALETRMVVVETDGRVVALVADQAREVLKLDRAAIRPPPPLVAERSGGLVRGVARLGERLLLLLDIQKTIGTGGAEDGAER
jgi:purine-binding chemotaxis protein CheW